MNRALKFRVWSKKWNKFISINSDQFKLIYQGDIWLISYPNTWFEDKTLNDGVILSEGGERDFIIQQYTGLKDKNCKMIYEGDIIIYTDADYFDGNWSERDIIEKVEFINGAFYPIHDFPPEVFSENLVAVIGNIFENQELNVN